MATMIGTDSFIKQVCCGLGIILALVCCGHCAVHNVPVPQPSPPPSNCSDCTLVEDINIELLPSSEAVGNSGEDDQQKYEHGDQENSEPIGPEVKVTLPVETDHWKTKIIIGCTVTAAVEIIVVIFIVVYWQEIRWTLRKFACPCEDFDHGNHEAMEHRQAETNQEPDIVQVYGLGREQEMQTYSTRHHGDEDEEDEDEERALEEVCLETSSV